MKPSPRVFTNKYAAICHICKQVVPPGDGTTQKITGPFSIIWKTAHKVCLRDLKEE